MSMKILWLANIPCGAAEKLSPSIVIGGWLKSLEEELVENDHINLSVAFYYRKHIEAFRLKKTTYYPVYRKGNGSKFGRLMNRMLPKKHADNSEVKEILKIVKEVKPDVIHVHGTEDNLGLIQKYTSIPVVVSIQGLLSPCSEKFFSGIPKLTAFINEGIRPKLLFSSSVSSYKKIKRNAKREQEILKISKNIIGRTDWDRRITRVLAPESKYFTGNEILRLPFYKMGWEKTKFGNIIQIVSTSTGGIYKGLETIVKTAQILKAYHTISFKWVIIGQNESGTLARLVKRWLKCDYKSLDIQFAGLKKEQELTDILINSDIYCQVSHIENSPNSLCEAMLVGMPVVASFAGGTDSMIKNKKEGIIVQDGDPYSYAGAIAEMANNFSMAKKMAKNARIHAKERHDKNKIVNSLINIYNSVTIKS